MTNRPHIANLRKRAAKLGLRITKTTTAQDAYDFGEHRYVLHAPNQDYMHMHDVSLYGIAAKLNQMEKGS